MIWEVILIGLLGILAVRVTGTMKRTIHIELGESGAVGTKATVITKRLIFLPRIEVFVCHRGAALMSAEWINETTGISADNALSIQLNEAAQAAARLASRQLQSRVEE